MNVVAEIKRINERELELGISGSASWHAKYSSSAYVFIGGLDYRLSEGDVISVFSQFGEVVDCHLVRDKESGKTKGFAFLAYEDQRSTVLAIDNMNGAMLLKRTIRCDHADKYRKPKKGEKKKPEIKDSDLVLPAEDDDEDYDERRKRIWDYELYDQQAAKINEDTNDPMDIDDLHNSNKVLNADDKHMKSVMAQLEERKAKRALARAQQEGQITPKEAARMEREIEAKARGTWGDAGAQEPATKEKKKKRSRQSRSRSRSRSRSDRRKSSRRSRSNSRSRSRSRDRRSKRSRRR